jgi:hypothetical protein
MHDQMQFADAGGDALIVSAGADGELVFTRKPRGTGLLVFTNLNVANPASAFEYPCVRYQTARRLLSGLVEQPGDLTARDVAAVLEATHMEGGSSWTISSLLADLPNRVVYLYHFDSPVALKGSEKVVHPNAEGPLSRPFPEEARQEATRRYERIQAQQSRCRRLGAGWLGAVLLGLVVFLPLTLSGSRRWSSWARRVC